MLIKTIQNTKQHNKWMQHNAKKLVYRHLHSSSLLLKYHVKNGRILFYTDHSVLLTRENVSVNVYIVLHILNRESLLRYVTLRLCNWHFKVDSKQKIFGKLFSWQLYLISKFSQKYPEWQSTKVFYFFIFRFISNIWSGDQKVVSLLIDQRSTY